MTAIKVLEESVINKIAAGEVIERPASVVKELVENSIDSGASLINIEISKAGKELIRVVDNGSGMSKEDAELSIQRHATSKISSADDLFSINTLGFRGEALASIAAVSNTAIMTKVKGSLEGTKLEILGGILKTNEAVGCPEGTTIEVKDLFFNTPARKKFMKTESNELRHIIDIITRYALINPSIGFRLIQDNTTIVNSPATQDLLGKISTIYGNEITKELLKVEHGNSLVSINGYISKPSLVRNDRSHQSIFVNRRFVKNNTINNALYDAYHSLLFVSKHPVAVLDIKINPTYTDVNVHPTKQEIKIDRKDEVYTAIFESMRNTLEANDLIFEREAGKEAQFTFGDVSIPVKPKEPRYSLEPSHQTVFREESTVNEQSSRVQAIEGSARFPAMKLLGQVNKTFFVAETEEGLIIIDQHVVMERTLYERFMNQYLNQKIETQALLNNEVLELTPQESIVLKNNLKSLDNIGFNIEDFGDNSFVVRSVPVIFGRVQTKDLLLGMINDIGGKKLEEIQEEIITRMSCRASVMAGDVLTIPFMEKMLKELGECKLPYTCPHGRPIFVKMTVDELEKMFRRK